MLSWLEFLCSVLPQPTPPPLGPLHRAADSIASAFIRASKGQRWRDCHLCSPQIRTDSRHVAHLYLRCHSRGKPGSRERLGVSTRRVYNGIHNRSLDKGSLGERSWRTKIFISTPRKIAGIRETANNFQWASPRLLQSGKGSGKEEWSPVFSVLFCAPGRIYCQSDHPHLKKASSTSRV